MKPSLSDYREFLAGVKNRVQDARIQAGRAINREVVLFCCKGRPFRAGCGKMRLALLKKKSTVFNMKATTNQPSIKAEILKIIARQGKGWAFTPHDFADVGDPRSVGMTLTRLVRDGVIRRLGRGLYDSPHPHPLLGKAGASSDSVVAAVARKKNLRILPSAAVAANKLGLSTQVPAKMIYHTDGAPSTVNLGKLKIEFRRNSGSKLALADRPSGLVAQALRDLGKGKVTAAHLQRLRASLPADARKSLLQDLNRVPAWIRPHFKELAR